MSLEVKIIIHSFLISIHSKFIMTSFIFLGCNSTNEIGELSGEVLSENFPGSYPPNSHCYYHIRAPSNFKIKLVFEKIDIEYDKRCRSDTITISDKPQRQFDTKCEFCQSICGNKNEEIVVVKNGVISKFEKQISDIVIENNSVFIHFSSDDSTELSGFKMMFQIIYNPKAVDPIDCKWNEFTPIGECTKSCGGGTHLSFRTKNQTALNGGNECEGGPLENLPCNEQPCPVDCKWGKFSPKTKCSKSCGEGTIIMMREKLQEAQHGGVNCTGGSSIAKSCNEGDCPRGK